LTKQNYEAFKKERVELLGDVAAYERFRALSSEEYYRKKSPWAAFKVGLELEPQRGANARFIRATNWVLKTEKGELVLLQRASRERLS